MPRTACALALTLIVLGSARPIGAQEARDLWAQGARAYQDLDFDRAAALLRSGFAHPAARSAPPADQLRALTFLGATELFRNSRDSAAAAFTRALLLDPRHRPDQLVFPPEVSTLYEEVRLSTRAVVPAVPARTTLAAAGDRLVMRLRATTYHEITVTVTGGRGETIRELYAGAVGDSIEVLWDGRDAAGNTVPAGSYDAVILSRGTATRPGRTVRVPLTVQRIQADTLAWPDPPHDSLLRRERTPGRAQTRYLLTGLGAAVAVTVLPSLVAGGAEASSGRFVVAAASGAAGIYGLVTSRTGRPIPENVSANQRLRSAWERQRDDVRARNVELRRQGALVVTAGALTVDSP